MKTVILAGGVGSRILEETTEKPKPMIEVCGMPILWHIMKIYSRYGHNEFIICAGYKQEYIKQWFSYYFNSRSDITYDYTQKTNSVIIHGTEIEPWKVTIVNTGQLTETGGRIKRIRKYLNDEPFFLTYGDGYANIDLSELLETHKHNEKKATVTAVRRPSFKGVLDVNKNDVIVFKEKDYRDEVLINGGFMVFQPDIFEYIADDKTSLEKDCLVKLAEEKELGYYRHNDFWQGIDTIYEKKILEDYLGRNLLIKY